MLPRFGASPLAKWQPMNLPSACFSSRLFFVVFAVGLPLTVRRPPPPTQPFSARFEASDSLVPSLPLSFSLALSSCLPPPPPPALWALWFCFVSALLTHSRG
uniref:Uncharacterized protein n=1 Tax=Leishmania guyanensis TaxID=5670 RepID=A0A1E1J2X3_LEIGU|nr:Hypothetical protein BN36_3154210 [Leishmania guyanensis]